MRGDNHPGVLRFLATMPVWGRTPNLPCKALASTQRSDTNMVGFADSALDLFKLPDEHNELRTVLRDICEKEIAP